MKGIEEIIHSGILYAIVVRKSFEADGHNFISKEHHALQVGVNFYKKGSEAKPHVHLKRKIELTEVQEVFVVDYGRTIANIYTENGEKIHSVELGGGDLIFFVTGGHGFEILDDTKIIEIKQGPYVGREKDKRMIV